MSEAIVVGKTYQEHLREVRARQFGYVIEEVGAIDSLPSVTVPKKKPTRKKKDKDNE